jgi:hypothetical protein
MTHPVHFEAGSASDIARIAVNIGKHAHQFGHEPDVDLFIINAHGSPDGMMLGARGERLDVSIYGNTKAPP